MSAHRGHCDRRMRFIYINVGECRNICLLIQEFASNIDRILSIRLFALRRSGANDCCD